MNNTRSLRQQLLRLLLILLTLILTVGSVVSYYRAYYFANLAYDRSLLRASLALADQVEVVDGQVTVDLPKKALDLLEYDKDDWIYYRVTDHHGRIVAGEVNLRLPSNIPAPSKHIYYDDILDGQPVRVAAFALPLDGTRVRGIALVQVAETRTKRNFMVKEIMEATISPQLLMMTLAAILLYFGVKRGLLPLDRLRLAISQRSYQDLSAVDTSDTPQEVQPLLTAMNDLMRRVREVIQLQQRFIADASHQLRTPLAGLQTQAEMALREQDPVAIRNALERIRASTVRVSHLVHQLLALARVEPGSGRELQLQLLDLAQLARDVSADWVSPALAKNIDFGFEAASGADSALMPVIVLGDGVLLREMLSNLIDNAIQYTPAGGRVTVSVVTAEGQAMLIVEDNGPGIPETDREQVFERFHRVAGSQGEGCGLGLAIVREIAHAHHAQILLEPGADQKGTRIQVVFSTRVISAP
jgi:two-component system sensor histidine kinase TctE